jgi:hypothetical protein
MKILKTILGAIVSVGGLGLMAAGAYLLVSQFTWWSILIFLFFSGYGFAVVNLGRTIIKGKGVRDALRYLLFLGSSSSLK